MKYFTLIIIKAHLSATVVRARRAPNNTLLSRAERSFTRVCGQKGQTHEETFVVSFIVCLPLHGVVYLLLLCGVVCLPLCGGVYILSDKSFGLFTIYSMSKGL